MSARAEKAARRATGISKQARRAEEDFERLVRARRAELADLPIVRLDGRRRALTLVALSFFALAILLSLLSSVFEAR